MLLNIQQYIIYIIRTQCFDDFKAFGELGGKRWESGTLKTENDLTVDISPMNAQQVRNMLGFMTQAGFNRLAVVILGRA